MFFLYKGWSKCLDFHSRGKVGANEHSYKLKPNDLMSIPHVRKPHDPMALIPRLTEVAAFVYHVPLHTWTPKTMEFP